MHLAIGWLARWVCAGGRYELSETARGMRLPPPVDVASVHRVVLALEAGYLLSAT